MTELEAQKCTCECGNVSYAVPDKPLFRMFCHCTICQKYNNAAYGDLFVYRATDIKKPAEGLVKFDTYRPPPNVQRGKCASCAVPVIEVLESPLLPNLIMVPGNMQRGSDHLPQSKGHVFYETRLQDIEDGLPKHMGYLKSQLVFAKHLATALLGRNRTKNP